MEEEYSHRCPNCGVDFTQTGMDPYENEEGTYTCRICGYIIPDYGTVGTYTYADTQRTIQTRQSDILPATTIQSKRSKKNKDGERGTNLDIINRMLQGQKTSQQDKLEKVNRKIKDAATKMDMSNMVKEAQNIALNYIKAFPAAHVRNEKFALAILFLLSERRNLFDGQILEAKLYEISDKSVDVDELKKGIIKWIQELKKFLPEYNIPSSQKTEENVQTYVILLTDHEILPKNVPFSFRKDVEDFVLRVKKLRNIKLPDEKMLILVSIFIVAKQKQLKLNMTNYNKDFESFLKVRLDLISKHEERILEAFEKQRRNPQLQPSECPSPPLTRRQIERKINERKVWIKNKIDQAFESQKRDPDFVWVDFDDNDKIYLTDEDKEKINILRQGYKPDESRDWIGMFPAFGYGGSKRNKTLNKRKYAKKTHKRKETRRKKNRCSCKSCR